MLIGAGLSLIFRADWPHRLFDPLFGSEHKRRRVALLHRQLHLRANFAPKKHLDVSLSFPSHPYGKAPYPLCNSLKLILTLER